MPLYSRKDMPQVTTQNLGKAISMAKSDVKVTKGVSRAFNLKPSQKELIPAKVRAVAKKYNRPMDMKPLIISKDGYIVDGHHRWAAAIQKFGKDAKIPTFTLHLKKDGAIKLYSLIANSINENITVPIKVGDTVLGGKFKNKRIVVKSIGKNEKGDITINNKPLLKFRLLPKNEDAQKISAKNYDAYKKDNKKKKNEIYFDRFGNPCKNPTTMDGRCIDKYHPSPTIREPLSDNKRIPRKKGQHRGSSSHSDLYTDENPKGTIKGLKFATVADAQKSVNKIKSSGKTHAHKIQAAVAMEQRAKEMGKKSAAGVYRSFINSMKKKTKKEVNETLQYNQIPPSMMKDFLPVGYMSYTTPEEKKKALKLYKDLKNTINKFWKDHDINRKIK